MAVIWYNGFDHFLTADLGKHLSNPGSGNTIVNTLSRSPGGQSLQPGTNTAGIGAAGQSFSTNYAQGVIGFAITMSSTTSRQLLFIADGTTEQISIRTTASSALTVTRAGTVLATGTTILSANTWYYIEVKFTIHNTAGVVELRLNGAGEIASTGSLDTQVTANAYWNHFAFPIFTSSGVYDDVYVIDPTTGANTTFLGPVRAVALYPAAAGNYAQWTSNGGTNMGTVSETYEDGDNTFNQSATANQLDSFVMDDLPASAGSVFALKPIVVARQDAGAARTVAPLFRIAGADYAGTGKPLSTSYQAVTQIYDQSPASSSAWTIAEVNGLEAGYKLVS